MESGGPRGYWPYTEREVRAPMESRRRTTLPTGREVHFASSAVAKVQVQLGLEDRKGATVRLIFRGLSKEI